MRRRLLRTALVVLTLAVLPLTTSAEEALSPDALRIANGLNCPVCEGQSVRDSNSQLARDMRRTVQEKLDEGHTEQEVYDYFVDRYGVGILREPPKSGFFMTLWWAPVIGFALGALALGTFVTQRRRASEPRSSHSNPEVEEDLSEYEQRVLRDLDAEFDSRDGRS